MGEVGGVGGRLRTTSYNGAKRSHGSRSENGKTMGQTLTKKRRRVAGKKLI